MKPYNHILFGLLVGLSSCNQQNNNNEAANSIDADTLYPASSATAKTSAEFNLDEVPVSTADLGIFPYLGVPERYKYTGDMKKKLEEKYFFYNDSLVKKVRGEYFHATVFSIDDGFEDTFVVSEYQTAIKKLGGLEIYSGGLPAAAFELIDKEKPAYVLDMYDPKPYNYKQFLIRTPKENIWIELCHGLNAPQIDVTVVKEERLIENQH